ncbi:NADP-dependent oxidoreductase domain-containing protein [Rhypophila decipiens]|uniref:NADP-dependent oxidoreductase domain-containing protein n=1 Tax=Rhypophila decipiens TaxID=261697 RepID=A0AAN6YA86_9PEZI|nr:NADP-dependent oxidoreductase domain-containing protein [Rhypophila decipiens]
MTPPTMPKTIAGKPVGPVGFGMMNLTLSCKLTHEEAIKSLKAALENGANFWNAGTFYGPPNANSLHLLKAYFAKYPEDAPKVVLSVKGLYNIRTNQPDCSPSGIRSAVDEALAILGRTKKIDLFEPARIDPNVPIETTVRTFAELIKQGKIASYGLSETSPSTIRRAHAILPPAAVEEELSLFSRHVLDRDGPDGGVADTCRELGIPLVGYSPMGSGWLTGNIKRLEDLPADDYRRHFPRFQPGAFERNVKLAEAVEGVAKKKGCSPAQVAIAWVIRQGVIAIPGATKVSRVEENCKLVELTDEEAAELQEAVDHTAVVGDRYPEAAQKHLSR